MKKFFPKSLVFVFACVVALNLFLSLSAFAAPVVKHEVIVAWDGSGDYLTITAALNSIIDASATNPYRISVRPGIYNESVVMKPYVDIVGSGQENTQITYAGTTPPVTGADSTALENIQVNNTGSGSFDTIAVPIGVNMVMRNITVVLTNNNSGRGIESVGGSSGSLQIFNSKIVLTAGQYSSRGINYGGTSLLVSGCDIEMNSVGSTWSIGIDGATTALTVINTIVNLTSTSFGNYGIYTLNGKIINSSITTVQTTPVPGQDHNYGVDGDNFAIYNSTITATTTNDPGSNSWGIKALGNISVANSSVSSSGYGIYMLGVVPGPLSVNNSQISGKTLGINKSAGNFTIGGSQIAGGHNGVLGTDKVVNCYDGNYNPLPNM